MKWFKKNKGNKGVVISEVKDKGYMIVSDKMTETEIALLKKLNESV